jgi:hypothetical protein
MLEQVAKDISLWLAQQVTERGFSARTFYGESLAVWLWSLFPGEFTREIDALLPCALRQLEREDIQAHPEFNLFALLNYCHNQGLSPKDLIYPFPKLRNTANSNWILLGTLDRLLWNRLTGERRFSEVWLRLHTHILLRLQQKDGLVRDDRLFARWLPIPFPLSKGGHFGIWHVARLRSMSLQYHCFSLALLWDIFQLTGWIELRKAIERGVMAILLFVLSNGDTLYLGRGQQQIFGYAALLYILAAVSNYSREQRIWQYWQRIWSFVSSYQRSDGSFPLVLRQDEHGYPHIVDTSDPCWLGWYGYNNYFDYLPFLGVYLARAAALLSDQVFEANSDLVKQSDQDLVVTRRYAVIREANWQATVAAPGGAISQDQPVPYFSLDGQSVLPCFGGEEYSSSLYGLSMLPLPYFTCRDGQPVYLRNVMTWSLGRGKTPRTLVLRGRCRWATFERLYKWATYEFIMTDTLQLLEPRSDFAEAFPLVFAAFQLDRQADGSYRIYPNMPSLVLHLQGVEGQLEIIPGTSPVGLTRVLREHLPWDHGTDQVFQRVMHLSWARG